jgi:hypothetical protein
MGSCPRRRAAPRRDGTHTIGIGSVAEVAVADAAEVAEAVVAFEALRGGH